MANNMLFILYISKKINAYNKYLTFNQIHMPTKDTNRSNLFQLIIKYQPRSVWLRSIHEMETRLLANLEWIVPNRKIYLCPFFMHVPFPTEVGSDLNLVSWNLVGKLLWFFWIQVSPRKIKYGPCHPSS